ncbi:MAG: NTP transferase domain-containing protein [Parcubacteria group bacterium]|nr:NTP transferase domain-containing protein [Parcubacteria group bacterium]
MTRLTKIAAVVLAGGKGKRLGFSIPKPLAPIADRPMVAYTLDTLARLRCDPIVVVIGPESESLWSPLLKDEYQMVVQPEPLGTADAALQGIRLLPAEIETVLVVNGDDSAFYSPETLQKVVRAHTESGAVVTFISLVVDEPRDLGRVIRDASGKIQALKEKRELAPGEETICEVNDGVYVLNRAWFLEVFPEIPKGSSGELYITRLIDIAIGQGERVEAYQLKDLTEWVGVNTPEELNEADLRMRERLRLSQS